MRIIPIITCLVAASAVSAFAAHNVTFYRDGALHQVETTAAKGMVQVPLPADLLEQTLTVVPAPGTTILTVETVKSGSATTAGKELDTLTEQRRRLEDRLLALETREAIFTSAAKSQSGKAPRKTKTNPDPMQAIRQGTDYAIAQLEAVYTARRKATQEIGRIDSRLAAIRKQSNQTEQTVRIGVTPSKGKVTVRYATSELGWQPEYNLRLIEKGSACLDFSARTTGSKRGYLTRASSGSLAESATAATFPIQSGSAVLARYTLPLTDEVYSDGIFKRFSGTITNASRYYLPTGETALFKNGAYLGKMRFEGISSGRSRVISLGR